MEILKIFERYINTDSNSYCKKDVDCFSGIIEDEGRKAGFAVNRLNQKTSGDFLEIKAGNGNRNILLLGHMDTVFPKGTAAERPFKYDKQRVYGPGVLDMKGGILVIMQAMKKLALNIPSDYGITALLNSDEEIGSPYSNEIITEKAKNAIAALSFEGTEPGTLTTSRNGILSFDIVIKGVPAHAGVCPELGRSAIREAAFKIQQLYELSEKDDNILVNIGKVSGGSAKNIIAENARIIGEVRYGNPKLREIIRKKLGDTVDKTNISGVKSKTTLLSDRPPMKSDEKCEKLFEAISRQAKLLGRTLVPRHTGGGGDAAFARAAGIPVIDGLGLEGKGAHTDKEYALLDSIDFKIELAVRTITALMTTESGILG